ncbi:capsule biosynthesis protein CapA [Campylobacter molothri]|uniref:capsule biosynthesis protein CapA n=1 Tax=Campylobacter molothri TaxID=1032242 RepID=UPI001F351BA6|nr:capsule biosynthesis protein CapA [Campylobacter sp. 2018MI35]
MHKPLIVAGRDDGFGERMRAFLNALYISKRLNCEFGFVWRDISGVQDLEEGKVLVPWANLPKKEFLFDKEFIEKYEKKELNFIYETPLFWSLYRKSNLTRLLERPYEKDWGWYSTYDDLSCYFKDVDKDEYRKSLMQCWQDIGFSKEVKDILKKVEKVSKNLGEFIAIHIRTGETIYVQELRNTQYVWRYKVLHYPLAIHLILKYLSKETKVILFCDDLELVYNLKKYSLEASGKNNVFIISDLINDMKGYEQIIFEIVLMSKAQKIYSSWTSGFSRCASYIGGNSIISVHEFFSIEEQYNLMNEYIEKIQDMHPLQKSCSYFYLYLLAKDLKISFETQKFFLLQALKNDPYNVNSQIFYINLLLENEKYEEANEILKNHWNENNFLNVLLDYHMDPALPVFIFTNYFKKGIQNYPLISKIAFMIFFHFYNHDSTINQRYSYLRVTILNLFYEIFYEQVDSVEKKIIGAAAIVSNHLAYKLGQAMIENSKSILGYLRMPYVLSYIKDKHKQEQKIYQEKIKKDPSLKLPPLESYADYNEALKFKEHLSYKLGGALISAHKNWYKGGYVKLWFEIRKLKKDKN